MRVENNRAILTSANVLVAGGKKRWKDLKEIVKKHRCLVFFSPLYFCIFRFFFVKKWRNWCNSLISSLPSCSSILLHQPSVFFSHFSCIHLLVTIIIIYFLFSLSFLEICLQLYTLRIQFLWYIIANFTGTLRVRRVGGDDFFFLSRFFEFANLPPLCNEFPEKLQKKYVVALSFFSLYLGYLNCFLFYSFFVLCPPWISCKTATTGRGKK